MIHFVETMETTWPSHWLKFVLLLAVLSPAETTPLCPNNCGCSVGAPASSLTIDCHGDQSVNAGQLSQQIDCLLSSNLSDGHLTRLTIKGTPLTQVPSSVCRLTTLTELLLDSNQLTRLPDDCISNLSSLTTISATSNHISQLQDGLFDGLSRLESLTLTNNSIQSIGLSVFDGSAGLTSLRTVRLDWNRIHTLEPWFYYVGVNGKLDGRSWVDLSHNNISAFTNRMGWKADCRGKKLYVELWLRYNKFRHISDVVRGWNINITTWLCLSPMQGGKKASVINFGGSLLACDCVDFRFYKLLHAPIKSILLSDAYCTSPASLYMRKVSSVPLDQFVCEVTERCPAGCRCVHRPANATLHVYCSNANLTALPRELPALPKSYSKYKLDFSDNRLIRRLEHRPYFVDAPFLDVSGCGVDSLNLETWNALANISQVLLDGNRLQTLPPAVAAVSLRRSRVSLGRNPWQCSCDARWMPVWLKSVESSLVNHNDITCTSPSRLEKRNIMSVSQEEFCEDPASAAIKMTLTISLSTVAGQ